jgi:hypothetical protein
LTRDHLAPREPLTKFHENRIWTAVYTYARELADVYRLCLAQYQVGAAGSAVLKRRLPQITCRALRACATQLKWMLLRYGPVEQRLWQELCGLYRLSESLGFAQVNCAMYPQIDSTPEREFLRAAVLAASSPDGLTPLQIDIAERVIEKVAHGFRVNQRPSSGISYVVELSGEHGPGRLSTNLKLTQDLRCFGPAGAAAEIERAVQFMDQHRASPPDLAIINLDTDKSKSLNLIAQVVHDYPRLPILVIAVATLGCIVHDGGAPQLTGARHRRPVGHQETVRRGFVGSATSRLISAVNVWNRPLNFVPCCVPTKPTELVSGTTFHLAANAPVLSTRPVARVGRRPSLSEAVRSMNG